MSTARGGCAREIESVSKALPAKTQNTAGGRVSENVKIARPIPQTETRRRAPYRVARSAPGIEATPSIKAASEVIEPVAEKLRPSSERMAGTQARTATSV